MTAEDWDKRLEEIIYRACTYVIHKDVAKASINSLVLDLIGLDENVPSLDLEDRDYMRGKAARQGRNLMRRSLRKVVKKPEKEK